MEALAREPELHHVATHRAALSPAEGPQRAEPRFGSKSFAPGAGTLRLVPSLNALECGTVVISASLGEFRRFLIHVHTDAVKTPRHVRETNSLVAAIGISVVATGLAGLATAYWGPAPTGWHWGMILPASVVLSAGPLSWWLRKRRDASRS